MSAHAGETSFRESGTRFGISVPGVRTAELVKAIKRGAGGSPSGSAGRLLDSLGFFRPRRDTLAADSIRIDAGLRSSIDSAAVSCDPPVAVDSMPFMRCPVPYDAGAVTALARDIVFHMARHGYPFASVVTDVKTRCGNAGVPDTACLRVTLEYRVNPDRRCVFAGPLFTGTTMTSRVQLAQDVLWRAGELYDAGKVAQTRERLMSRPYVVSVDMLPPVIRRTADSLPCRSDTCAEQAVVPITVADRSGLGLDGAVAVDGGTGRNVGLTGFLDFSIMNIFGAGERGVLNYRGDSSGHQLELGISKVRMLGLPLIVHLGYGLELKEHLYGSMKGDGRLLYELTTRWATGLGFKANEATDSTGMRSSLYYGGDYILKRLAEPLRRETRSRELTVETGTGVATRSGRRFNRSHLDFTAGAQAPFLRVHAVRGRLVTRNLFTQEADVPTVDLYRTGGVRSVRGYGDDQWAFRNVVYGQCEYLYYFSAAGAGYVFADAGFGFTSGLSLERNDRTTLLGYGAGVRIPVAIGTASIEWARSKDDVKSLGRIHLRVSNALADVVDW